MSSQLKRELHFWDSVAINIGIIIGVGIFRVPAEVAKHLTDPAVIIFAWISGGLIAHLGALCYAELSSRYPHTGGTYVFIREGYGKLPGFLFGWTEIVILRAGSIAAVAYVFSTYLRNFFALGPMSEKMIAVGLIGILTVINILGVKLGTRIQNIFSSLKVITILSMAAAIFFFAARRLDAPAFSAAQFFDPSNLNSHSLFLFAAAIVPILWTYGGWHESAFMSGEFRDTKWELPASLLTSALVVTVLYVVINIAYLRVVPPAEMAGTKAIASEVFNRMFGSGGTVIMTAAVLVSSVGALNSTIMTGGRIPFAVASDYPKFKWAADVDSRFNTPRRSLEINGIWAGVLVLFGSFEQLVYFCQFAQWLFFGLAGFSIFIARAKQKQMETFSMLGYPFVPAVFTLIAACVCASIIWYTPKASLIGVILILAGIPVYHWLTRR